MKSRNPFDYIAWIAWDAQRRDQQRGRRSVEFLRSAADVGLDHSDALFKPGSEGLYSKNMDALGIGMGKHSAVWVEGE